MKEFTKEERKTLKEIDKKIISLQEDYKNNLNKIGKGQCVMCGGEGKYAIDNGELLCSKHWDMNEELKAKNKGDIIIKI